MTSLDTLREIFDKHDKALLEQWIEQQVKILGFEYMISKQALERMHGMPEALDTIVRLKKQHMIEQAISKLLEATEWENQSVLGEKLSIVGRLVLLDPRPIFQPPIEPKDEPDDSPLGSLNAWDDVT